MDDFLADSYETMNEKSDGCSATRANLEYRRRGRKGYIELDIGVNTSSSDPIAFKIVLTGVAEGHSEGENTRII